MPRHDVLLHVGTITYYEDADSTVLIGWTSDALLDLVYEYVRERWEVWHDPDEGEHLPGNKVEALDQYFEAAQDNERYEYYTARLPYPPPAGITLLEAAESTAGFEPPVAPVLETGDALNRIS